MGTTAQHVAPRGPRRKRSAERLFDIRERQRRGVAKVRMVARLNAAKRKHGLLASSALDADLPDIMVKSGTFKPRRLNSSIADTSAPSSRRSRLSRLSRRSKVMSGRSTAVAPTGLKYNHTTAAAGGRLPNIEDDGHEGHEVESEPLMFQAGSERHQRFKRAKYGVLLSILERRVTGGKMQMFVMFKVIPVMLLTLDFLQLNGFNARKLSPAIDGPESPSPKLYDTLYLGIYDVASINLNNTEVAFVGAVFAVLLCLAGVMALTVAFLMNKQRTVLFSAVGGYMTLLTTFVYMPIIRAFSAAFQCGADGAVTAWVGLKCGESRHLGFSMISGMGLILYVPLCMFISQNNFERDPHANHLLRRPSGRFAVLNLTAKTLLVLTETFLIEKVTTIEPFGASDDAIWGGFYQNETLSTFTTGTLASRTTIVIDNSTVTTIEAEMRASLPWIHLFLFAGLLVSFRLLQPYHVAAMNTLHSLFLAIEVIGAMSVVALALMPAYRNIITMIAYPVLLLLSPALARVSFPSIMQQRFRALLTDMYRIFDLANDPSLPYTLGLDHLLKTATRCGQYAEFLHRVAKEEKTARYFYQHALRADPDHATNLGKHANFLFSTGHITEARAMFKRAIAVDPNHVENLGMCARFLTMAENPPRIAEADEMYRQVVSRDPEHERFLGFYSASSDGLLILNTEGYIEDCNGTALRMFHGSTRKSLLGLMLLDMCYFSHLDDPQQAHAEVKMLRATADAHIATCLYSGSCSFMWTFQSFLPPGSSGLCPAATSTGNRGADDSLNAGPRHKQSPNMLDSAVAVISKMNSDRLGNAKNSLQTKTVRSVMVKSGLNVDDDDDDEKMFLAQTSTKSPQSTSRVRSLEFTKISTAPTANEEADDSTKAESSLKQWPRNRKRRNSFNTSFLAEKSDPARNFIHDNDTAALQSTEADAIDIKSLTTAEKNKLSGFSFEKSQGVVHRRMLDLSEEESKYVFQAEVLFTLQVVGGRRYIQASIRDVAKLGLLLEKERQFVTILENLFDAVVLVDYFGTIKTTNSTALDMFGFSLASDLEKKNVKMLIPELESENELSGESKIPMLVGMDTSMQGVRKDGTTFNVTVRGSVLEEKDNVMKAVFALIVKASTDANGLRRTP